MASTAINRLVIVSNRLPVTVVAEDGQVRLEQSSGGLATGLAGAHERRAGLWVGWPGDTSTLTDAQAQHVRGEFERQRIVPVDLSTDEVQRYYEGFSNSVVWPLFHYLLDRVPLDADEWDAYYEVNRKFAGRDRAPCYEPGDLIWVHDYQLMLGARPAARSACRRAASASSCTSRFRRSRCSASCRGGGNCSKGCSARI